MHIYWLPFIHIYYFRHDIAEEKDGDRWVEVKTFDDICDAEWYKISNKATIGDLKGMIAERDDITDSPRLIFAGTRLHNDITIGSLQTDDPETFRIHLIQELVGGGTFRTRYGAISIYNVLVNMFDEKRCLFVN